MLASFPGMIHLQLAWCLQYASIVPDPHTWVDASDMYFLMGFMSSLGCRLTFWHSPCVWSGPLSKCYLHLLLGVL